MFAPVLRLLTWWIEGLVDALLKLGGVFGRRRPVRLLPGDHTAILDGPKRGSRVEIGLDRHPDGTISLEGQQTRRLLGGQAVEIVPPAETLIVRTLDPLPAESRPYLDGVVRHQLERLTPWLPADVIYAYETKPVGLSDPRLSVTFAATARSLHAGLVAAVRAAGAKDVRLVPSDPAFAGPVTIALDAGAGAAARRRRVRGWVVGTLATACLALVAGIGFLTYRLDLLEADVATVQDAIDGRRRIIAEAANASRDPAARRDLDALLARKAAAPLAVVAIDSLSAALPDDTWVNEVRLGEGQVRIMGTTRNVAGLVPLVEESPVFAGAGFFAPTTRLPDGTGDRFNIEARWQPLAEAKP